MKKVFTLTLCALLLFGMIFAVNANADIPETEADILDDMARSWLNTCEANSNACETGLDIYALGVFTGIDEEVLTQVYAPLKQGLIDEIHGMEDVHVKLDVEKVAEALYNKMDGDLFEEAVNTFIETEGAEFLSDDWYANVEAESTVKETLVDGEIAEDVSIMEVIKENYVLLSGKVCCDMAADYFQEALGTNDLTEKRNKMLTGACLATFGCEMSIEDADEIVKVLYSEDVDQSEEALHMQIMTRIADNAMSVAETLVPQIETINTAIEITTDITLKLLSMREKIDALAGYMMAPETIEEDRDGYYQALSNQYGAYTYEISDGEITMDEYNGYLLSEADYVDVNIPEYLHGFPVVAFGGVFAEGLIIQNITIPSSIRSRTLMPVIKDCDKLVTVKYNAINCKGWYLHYFFEDCDSDFKVEFGPGIESISERFIARCGLSSITFPEGVTTIHSGALVDCPNLTTVTIPSTVEEFAIDFGGVAVISGCPKLEKVYYNTPNPKGSYYNWVIADSGNEVAEMSLIFGKDIQTIPVNFLKDCGVKTVAFPEGVTKIGEYSITGCQKLETITIPSSVTQLSNGTTSDYVFGKCENLKTVNYYAPNAKGVAVAAIFYDIPSDFQMNFSKQIESIPENFMKKCGVTSIAFPEGVKTIHNSCLVDCDALKTVTVPSTVETVEYKFAWGCDNIETIYFNANCTTSPNSTLISDCGNFENPCMQVLLGDNVTTVPAHFIENCAITEFAYPEGVKTIYGRSLVNCSALETVVIPSTVETVYYELVSNCNNLKTIDYRAINAVHDGEHMCLFTHSGAADGLEVRFAENIQSLPRRFMYMCTVSSVAFPEGLTKIPERTFSDCAQLNSLTIPESITTIDNSAFPDCTGLTEIHFNPIAMNDLKENNGVFASAGVDGAGITVFLGDRVTKIPNYLFSPASLRVGNPKITNVQFAKKNVCTSIGEYSFSYCTSLPAIHIPTGVKTVGEGAFSNCTILTDVTIGKTVTELGDVAFSGCENLPAVVIPANVTTIGEGVFSDCTSLTDVTIGSGITEIPRKAFSNCTSLKNIFVLDNIATIEFAAFSGCTGLTGIVMQDGVAEIDTYAFKDCSELSSVIYCGTEKQWNNISISNNENQYLKNASRQYHDYHKETGTTALVCAICGDRLELVPTNLSMVIGNTLKVYVWVQQSNINGEGYYAEVTQQLADGVREETIYQKDWIKDDVAGVWKIPYAGIAAKEMTDEITVIVYDANGKQVTKERRATVESYALSQFAKAKSDELKTVLVDMLNYGAEAQKYFGYKVDTLANANLTEEHQKYATGDVQADDNRKVGGNITASLSLENSLEMNFMVRGDAYTRAEYAIVTLTNHYGEEIELRYDKLEKKDYQGVRVGCVTVDILAIADVETMVHCKVYNAFDKELTYCDYSVETYVARMSDNAELAAINEAIMKFGVSAYNYFH